MSVEKSTSIPLRTLRIQAQGGDFAAQAELARRLVGRKKFEEALVWYRSAARGGDPNSQMELGLFLCWDRDAYGEGIRWIRCAAKQQHVGAQYFLGAELATGENVRKNVAESARWYRRAAMKGHGEAQYNLAMMYWAGEGVPRNTILSHRWLEKAAKSGDWGALSALADAYEDGLLGYRKNGSRARYWRSRYDRIREAESKRVARNARAEPSRQASG